MTLSSVWTRLLVSVFGFDFFISYRRSDASVYAEALRSRLVADGYVCFLDREEAGAARLTPALRRALRASRFLTVIVTDGVVQSTWVHDEIRHFVARSDQVMPISVGGFLASHAALPDALELLRRFTWLDEPKQAVVDGLPSESVVEDLKKAHSRIRVRTMGRICAGIVLVVALATSAWVWQRDRDTSERTASALLNASRESAIPEQAIRFAAIAAREAPSTELRRKTEANLIHLAHASSLRAVLSGHSSALQDVAWSPDGKRIVTAGYDRKAILWDAESAVPVATLEHAGPVVAVAFSADGRRLVTGSHDMRARLWDAASGRSLGVLKGHTNSVLSVAINADGSRVITGSSVEDTPRLWNADKMQLISTLYGQTELIGDVAFSKDGERAVTASLDKTVRLWDARSGALIATLSKHSDWVRAVVFDPTGAVLATGSSDHSIWLWDGRTGAPLRELGRHGDDVVALAFDSTGRRLASGSEDQTARVWQIDSGVSIELPGHAQQPVMAVAFSPDDRQVLTGAWDGSARLWDVSTSTPVATELPGHALAVVAVAFSPDGSQCVTASSDGTARIWSTHNGQAVAVIAGHATGVGAVAFSSDGKRFATASSDARVQLWGETGALTGSFASLGGQTRALAFASNDESLVVGTHEGAIGLLNTRSGEITWSLQEQNVAPGTVSVSGDGSRVAAVVDGTRLRLWDTHNKQQVAEWTTNQSQVLATALAANGQAVATVSMDQFARLWDPSSNQRRVALQEYKPEDDRGGFMGVALGPDAQTLATVAGDIDIKLWDTQRSEKRAALIGHQGNVFASAFSRDGQRMITGSDDNTAILWDVASGEPLARFVGHRGKVDAVAISPSGQILTGSADGTARLWTAELAGKSGDELIEAVCKTRLVGAASITDADVTKQPVLGKYRGSSACRDDTGWRGWLRSLARWTETAHR